METIVPVRSLSSPSPALASTRLFSRSAHSFDRLPRRHRLVPTTAHNRSIIRRGFGLISPIICLPIQLRGNFCALSARAVATSSVQPSPESENSESETESEYETEEEYNSSEEYAEGEGATVGNGDTRPPVKRRRRRYRMQYPGETKGITEEMRFVAMKLRKTGKSKTENVNSESNGEEKEDNGNDVNSERNGEEKEDIGNGETWQPSIEGFLKYLVDSKLVFSTVERIVDESSDVSYVYFRKTGLERSDCISRDLEWLREQGNVIPEPSNPGVTYAQYLKELAENSPPLFLCHFYNIYFSHIAGGQVIARKASKMQFGGREMETYKWEEDEQELLRGVREKLNALGEHWSRDEKNKCLREATKAFRSLGQILRLIIL